MNREEIIKLAREAGFESNSLGVTYTSGWLPDLLERFAALVAAAEREACAKVCEDESRRAKWNWDNDISGNKPFWNGGEQLASSCAAAIRARGNK
jgi:hypothetical protein